MQPSLLSYLRKLRNHRFAEAYELISSNLVIDELEADNVTQAIDNVQVYAKELNLLKNLVRKHPITQQMDQLKHERHQALLSLRGLVSYFLRSPSATERANGNKIHIWLLAYHEFFKGESIHDQSRLVANMCSELDDSSDLQLCVTELNLFGTIDTIRSVTNSMRELHLTRLKHKKEEAAKAKLIRETAFSHIVTLWKVLEVSVALKTHDGQLCRSLFESINWVIIDFKARYLGQATRRINEKLKKENETGGETPTPETPVTP